MGTPEAYHAYLSAYPGGFFAALARAALAKASPARAPAPAGDGGTPALPGPSPALRHFAAPVTRSGAVTFNLGDRFNGPGVLTVGWAGAKRQVVVPPGEWVVLAMADAKVDMTPPMYRFPTRVVADVGTLVLGRFSGMRLASAMVYQSSVRPISVDDWNDIAGCQPGASETLHHENTRPSGLRSACVAVRAVPAPQNAATPAMEEARASLARLGAEVQGDALATIAAVWESRRGYLAGTRLDWPGVALGAAADAAGAWSPAMVALDPGRAATVARLVEWLGTYRNLVDAAYGFRIDRVDLEPGAGAPAGRSGSGDPLGNLRDLQPG
ncbi:MAG: hypothetical protein JNL85_06155 [Rubrivivax sp.]|nr:hypothetical protein [Rubrivivax sp.]